MTAPDLFLSVMVHDPPNREIVDNINSVTLASQHVQFFRLRLKVYILPQKWNNHRPSFPTIVIYLSQVLP